MCHLVERANGGLEDQVGVEEEGAQKRLRVSGQLCQDARQQQVGVHRVGQHVLQAGQQDADKGTCRRLSSFICSSNVQSQSEHQSVLLLDGRKHN